MPQTHFTMWQYKLLLHSSIQIINNYVCASSFMSFAPNGMIWIYILVAVGIYRILILWLPVRGKTSAAFSCDRSVWCEWENVLLPAIENTHKQKKIKIITSSEHILALLNICYIQFTYEGMYAFTYTHYFTYSNEGASHYEMN